MPSSHRRYADWTIGRIRRDVALIGPATAALCELIQDKRSHPELVRSCHGILRVARGFGIALLEAAALRAIEIGALTCGSVRSILDHKLDRHAGHKRQRTARRSIIPTSAGRVITNRGDGTLLTHPTLDLLHQLGLKRHGQSL